MKIAVLGGGFTGLTAAYYLRKAGHEVTVFEKETVLGGLASGFKSEGWDWHLERAYHHLFANDSEILGFAKETGFHDVFFSTPETASLYRLGEDQLKIINLDTPVDLLKFPLLTLPERLRAGITLAALKLSPFLKLYEQQSASKFLRSWMGGKAYGLLFGELFRKKFGKYAENIVASFIWTRIKKRTKNLGYINGGFQIFLNYLEHVLEEQGVVIEKGVAVEQVRRLDDDFAVRVKREAGSEQMAFDRVVCTLPTPIVAKVMTELLPEDYLNRLRKIQYLNAACLILETTEKLVPNTYWLSVCVPEFPMMVAVQHTNMIPAEHYGGKELLYVANYVENDHPLLRMDADQALEYYKPALDAINPIFTKSVTKSFYFRAPFAQPIFDAEFVTIKPDFTTPVPGFYMANLDMTYPQDRGTNYAVKLGQDVAQMISRA